jgi:hypothetical protein
VLASHCLLLMSLELELGLMMFAYRNCNKSRPGSNKTTPGGRTKTPPVYYIRIQSKEHKHMKHRVRVRVRVRVKQHRRYTKAIFVYWRPAIKT